MDLKDVKALRNSQETILILLMWLDKVDWLIEQAEKAERLEKVINDTGIMLQEKIDNFDHKKLSINRFHEILVMQEFINSKIKETQE